MTAPTSPPSRVLGLSTSTPRGGAAIVLGDRVLGAAAYDDLAHAERIFAAIDEALGAAGLGREAIEAVACDVGPGSFTGVRVGVAAAKGIALALDVPLVGVTSLEAMAFEAFATGAAGPGDRCAPLLDAKKGEVFLAAYDASLTPLLAPEHAPREEALARVPAGAVVVGAVAAELAGAGAAIARGPGLDLPSAAAIARIGAGRIGGAPGAHDPGLLEPLYVRAPDARPAAT